MRARAVHENFVVMQYAWPRMANWYVGDVGLVIGRRFETLGVRVCFFL